MKRQISNDGSSDDEDDNDEIFQFSNRERLTFSSKQPSKKACVLDSSDDDDSNSDDDSDESDDSSSSEEEDEKDNTDRLPTDKESTHTIEESPPSPPSPPPPPPSEQDILTPPIRQNNLLSRLKERISAVTPNTSMTSSIDLCSSFEEESFNVKVKIHGLIKRYYIPRSKPMEYLFEMIASNEEVNKTNISLSLKSANVSYNDTADSLNLTIASILECVILEDMVVNEQQDLITVKVQTSCRNTRTEYQVGQKSSLSGILKEFCTKNKHVFEKCIFEFDAETFDPASNPADVGLEDGDIIDVIT